MGGIGMLMDENGNVFSHIDGSLIDGGYRLSGHNEEGKNISNDYFKVNVIEAMANSYKEGLTNIVSIQPLSGVNLFKDKKLKHKFNLK